jgi:exopolysaccharide biosynthesis polyprenyl glycosylphosphotransferase
MNLELGAFRADTVRVSARRTRWRRNERQIRGLAILSLLLLDATSICLGFGVTTLMLSTREVLITGSLGLALTGMLVLHLVIAINSGAYSIDNLRSPWTAMSRGTRAFLIAAGAVVLMAFCFKMSSNLSRLALSCGVLGSTVLIAVTRDQFVRHAAKLMGGNVYSIALIMDGDQKVPLDNISIVISAGEQLDPDRHDPAMYDLLAKTLSFADRVIVACPEARRMSWAHALKGANIQSEIIVPELMRLQPLGQGWHQGVPTVIVAKGPLHLPDRIVKRGFDLAISGAALLFLAPLLLITAMAIKFDTPGPIFFVQTRIGRGNKQFRMLKFRSMRNESCDGAGNASTARDDDRITRIGRLIRSTSIDELPQLLCVLRGDMSVVGPRPHALGSRAEDKLFWEIDERYWHRHAIKPGLTGLAQVRGFRGATHRRLDLVNRLQADLEYVDNWSILRDVKILFMTVRVVLHRNAF